MAQPKVKTQTLRTAPPPAMTPDPAPVVRSDPYTRADFARRVEAEYAPYVEATPSLDQDVVTIRDLRPSGPGPEPQPYTLAQATEKYPLPPRAPASLPVAAETPGVESWKRYQAAQTRKAEAAQTINPQLPFLESLVGPWHSFHWDKELEEEVRLLGEDLPRADMMAVDWHLRQACQREWEFRRTQLDTLADARQAIGQLEKNVTLPGDRIKPMGQVLRVNLEPSRSAAEFVSPPEWCRRMRKRLEAAMDEAATKAEKLVGAPVAPAPRALPPEPPRPAPAETDWTPGVNLGWTPGKI